MTGRACGQEAVIPVIEIADAKAHLSELVDRAEADETIDIARHGRIVARLMPSLSVRKPVDVAALTAVTDDLAESTESAGDFVSALRDSDRY